MLEIIESVNGKVNGFVWGVVGLALLIGTGILMTCATKFFQVSRLGHWWKETIGSLFKKEVISHTKEKGAISPFQALCTALAATVGTGNIAGVAAAICIGGAGAVFWMWVAAFFGMMTNYSENVLGMYFRRRNKEGEWSGGAMYYLTDGLGKKKGMKILAKVLAILFSFFNERLETADFVFLRVLAAEKERKLPLENSRIYSRRSEQLYLGLVWHSPPARNRRYYDCSHKVFPDFPCSPLGEGNGWKPL